MKIQLTKNVVKRLLVEMKSCFKMHPTWDVLEITDDFLDCFLCRVHETGYIQIITIDDFYDTLDAYKDLQETYQTLVYHHELYRKGKTPLDAFIGVCDGLSADELRLL